MEEEKGKVEEKDTVYECGDCKKIVYLMEAGRGENLACCDNKMRKLSEEEKKPYHPRFPKPGSP